MLINVMLIKKTCTSSILTSVPDLGGVARLLGLWRIDYDVTFATKGGFNPSGLRHCSQDWS